MQPKLVKCQIPWCGVHHPKQQLRKIKMSQRTTLLVCRFHRDCYGENVSRLRWLIERKNWNPELIITRPRIPGYRRGPYVHH